MVVCADARRKREAFAHGPPRLGGHSRIPLKQKPRTARRSSVRLLRTANAKGVRLSERLDSKPRDCLPTRLQARARRYRRQAPGIRRSGSFDSRQFSFRQLRIVRGQCQAIISSFGVECPLGALNLFPRPSRVALGHDGVIAGRFISAALAASV